MRGSPVSGRLGKTVLDPGLEQPAGDGEHDRPDEDPDQAEAEHAPDDAGGCGRPESATDFASAVTP
jgi:hypothetical protein